MPSNTENFKKYKSNLFIETGSFQGDGIQQALDAGYEKVISIELSEKYFEISRNRFISDPRVTIVKGDSYKVLPSILNEIKEKCTFWLDGHHSCGDTALGDYWAPLIQELDAIKNHWIKNHTIMIDDMRCWQEPNPVHGFFIEDIYKKINEINSNYLIDFLDGGERHNRLEKDILVAYL
jgi:hypothetical protein